jgi:hypothetical protein
MIDTPGLTAADYEKLDNKTKALRASQYIKKVWNRDCDAIGVMPVGRFMGQTDSWQVKCSGSNLDYDYSLRLPVPPRSPNGQVMPCYRTQNGSMGCSITGRPLS